MPGSVTLGCFVLIEIAKLFPKQLWRGPFPPAGLKKSKLPTSFISLPVYIVCVCACMCRYVSVGAHGVQQRVTSPRIIVTDGCKLHRVGAENQTEVSCMS